MMKKSFLKKASLGLVGLALLGTMAGCGEKKKAAANGDGEATLTGFISYGGNSSATQKAKWFSAILKDELGITLNLQDDAGTSAGQIMQSLLTSGELPDIVGFSSKTDAQNAANAGLLLNLDDYKDELPNLYKNKNFANAIAYQKDSVGGKDGGLYTMQTAIGPQDDVNFNPQLRWDIYKEIGKPEIKTLNDYLPALKKMQEAYPQTEDGKKVYALSLFNGWDTSDMALASYIATLYGVDSREIHRFTEIPSNGEGEIKSILDDDSQYKKVLDFFYEANQEGLVDPDSITQKWDSVLDKYNNGRILFSPWQWATAGFNTTERTNKADFQGYQSVWADDFTVPVMQDNVTGDGGRTLGISSATKNKKAALKFLNYFYSYECVDLLYNGPKGQVWDEDNQGLRYVTDQGFDIQDNSKPLEGGGTILDAYNIINSSAMTKQTINPETKDQTISNAYWESTLNRNTEGNQLVADWRADHDNAIDMFHYAKDNNKYLEKTTFAFSIMAPTSDELQTSVTQIGDVVKTYSWKMVFAKNEKEYNQLWKEMKEKANGLGIEKVIASRTNAFKEAMETAGKYSE